MSLGLRILIILKLLDPFHQKAHYIFVSTIFYRLYKLQLDYLLLLSLLNTNSKHWKWFSAHMLQQRGSIYMIWKCCIYHVVFILHHLETFSGTYHNIYNILISNNLSIKLLILQRINHNQNWLISPFTSLQNLLIIISLNSKMLLPNLLFKMCAVIFTCKITSYKVRY